MARSKNPTSVVTWEMTICLRVTTMTTGTTGTTMGTTATMVHIIMMMTNTMSTATRMQLNPASVVFWKAVACSRATITLSKPRLSMLWPEP